MATTTSSATSPYPFASAPDIIRSHQKDAYFTGHLTNTLTDLHRRLLGARSAHSLAPELNTFASLLYFSLTTLPGNRTLGEEYCDLVQVEQADGRLPDIKRRVAYVAGSILLPYLAARMLPRLRRKLQSQLEKRLSTLKRANKTESKEFRLWSYLSRNLPSLTSSGPMQALTLAVFYFSGTYYELSKRLLSLRYVFTRTVPDTPDRGGYEVLGVLLVIQFAVQSYLHIKNTLSEVAARDRSAVPGTTNVSLDHDNSYSTNNQLLSDIGAQGSQATRVDIAVATHTPIGTTPRYELTDEKVMGYIKGQQQRKCTLCLDEMKDPAATQCGHVFCWECIGDWVREKPECPLCRRDAMVQHILPLQVM